VDWGCQSNQLTQVSPGRLQVSGVTLWEFREYLHAMLWRVCSSFRHLLSALSSLRLWVHYQLTQVSPSRLQVSGVTLWELREYLHAMLWHVCSSFRHLLSALSSLRLWVHYQLTQVSPGRLQVSGVTLWEFREYLHAMLWRVCSSFRHLLSALSSLRLCT